MNVVNGKLSLIFGEFYLKETISNGVESIGSQEFTADVNLLGPISMVVPSIRLIDLKVSSGIILLELEIELKIVPQSRLLPALEGVILMGGNLQMMVGEEGFDAKFKMSAFSWLHGPTSLRTGKGMRLIGAATNLIANHLNVIERSIEEQICELFSPGQIGVLISGLPEHVVIADLVLSMSAIQINVEFLQIVDRHLEVRLNLDTTYILAKEELKVGFEKGIVLGKSSTEDSRFYISQAEIDFLLSTKLDLINDSLESSPVKIDKVELELEVGALIVKITPQGLLTEPIIGRLVVSTGPDAQLTLESLEISSHPNSSVFMKTLLRLISAKVESKIEKYFPLHFNVIEEFIASEVKQINGTIKGPPQISMNGFSIRAIEVLERQLMIQSSAMIQIVAD